MRLATHVFVLILQVKSWRFLTKTLRVLILLSFEVVDLSSTPPGRGASASLGGRPFCEATENGSACELHTANANFFVSSRSINVACELHTANALQFDWLGLTQL